MADSCLLRKQAGERVTDPETGEEVPLYTRRRDAGSEHFRWRGVYHLALTPTAGATIEALAMNRPPIIAIRAETAALERHPPSVESNTQRI